jgi:hypothetical protein
MADKVKFVVVLSPIYSTNIFEGGLSRSAGTVTLLFSLSYNLL